MSEFLRKYWFVALLGVIFFGVLVYFIMDINKDSVKTTKVDGQDVVVSTTLGDVTSNALFEDNAQNTNNLLYSLYRNAVVDQAVAQDSEMEKEAKAIAKNLRANLKANPDSEDTIKTLQQLASLGFEGDKAVEDYARIVGKMRKLDTEFVKESISKLSSYIPEGARTISLLTIQVEDTENLTEEESKLKEDIQKALDEKKPFAEIVATYSQDETTKAKDGFYGYIDSSTTTLDSEIITAATALKNGEVSDWIAVQSAGAQGYTLYRIQVEETDVAKILEMADETVVEALSDAIIQKANGLEVLAVKQAAQKLNITFEDETVQKDLEEYINAQVETLEAEIGIPTETKDTKEESTEASSEKSEASHTSSSATSSTSSENSKASTSSASTSSKEKEAK